MSAVFLNILARNALRIRRSCNIYLNRVKSTKENAPGYFTMQDVKRELMEVMAIKEHYSPSQEKREHLLKYIPKTQEELPSRSMQDSFSEVFVPLESDIHLRDKYITYLGQVRIGRLMEDMDMFAVWVAERHILNPKLEPGVPTPYVLVTILVERIQMEDIRPVVHGDIRLSGHVSWVGRSSMEIVVWMEQRFGDEWKKLTRALFLMAARNSTNTASAPVNILVPASKYEKDILAGGKERLARRIKIRSESLLRTVPDECEQKVLHEIFLSTLESSNTSFLSQRLPPNCQWMHKATLSNIIFCQPQHRNLHNTVFGGFIMRQAVELAWMEAYMYTSHVPKLLLMADITFEKAVDVGSVLKMQSVVTYTENCIMTVIVFAQILNPKGKISTSNNFHFIFKAPEKVQKVIPRSYAEAMLYITGRRKFHYLPPGRRE